MSNNQKAAKIDLNHLLVFNRIAESRNLTEAARILGQDKTRLSRILSELEKTLGVELIYRTTRQFRLTEAGEKLYEKSRNQIASLQNTAAEFWTDTGSLRGHIRLTGAHGVFARLITPVIADFRRVHPEVTFELIFAQQSLDLIKEGIDLAVRMGKPKDSTLKMRVIGELEASFVASPKYLRANGAPANLAELQGYDLLMLESLNKKIITLTDNKRTQDVLLKGAISANTPDVLLDMTIEGLGISLLPEIILRDHIATREVVPLLPGWKIPNLPVCLLFAHKHQQATHIKKFSSFLIERFQRAIQSNRSLLF